MTLPDAPGAAAPSWLLEVPLAHRGLHDEELPENSLPAFRAAAKAGYGVELDVHLSRDGQPVVLHDSTLSRVAGDERRVSALSAAELGELRLRGSQHGIPTLREALDELTDVPVMIEVKSSRLRPSALERGVAALVRYHPGPVCVASFNPVVLRWFKRRYPDTVRVLTATTEGLSGFTAPLLRRLADLRDLPTVSPAAVSYDLQGLPHPAVDAWRRLGGTVVTWTVASSEDAAKAEGLADNIIFENIRPDTPAS